MMPETDIGAMSCSHSNHSERKSTALIVIILTLRVEPLVALAADLLAEAREPQQLARVARERVGRRLVDHRLDQAAQLGHLLAERL